MFYIFFSSSKRVPLKWICFAVLRLSRFAVRRNKDFLMKGLCEAEPICELFSILFLVCLNWDICKIYVRKKQKQNSNAFHLNCFFFLWVWISFKLKTCLSCVCERAHSYELFPTITSVCKLKQTVENCMYVYRQGVKKNQAQNQSFISNKDDGLDATKK